MFFTVGRVELAKQNQPNYWSVSWLNYHEEHLSWNSRSCRYYSYLVYWDEATSGFEVEFWVSGRGHCVVMYMYVQFLSSTVGIPATGVATGPTNWPALRMVLPLQESFSFSEVQFKKFFLPVKTSGPFPEKVNEIPAANGWWMLGTFQFSQYSLYFGQVTFTM